MYRVRKKVIIIDYVYYNKKIFHDFLPHPKEIKINFLPSYENVLAEVVYDQNIKPFIFLNFRTKWFKTRKQYLEVLIHEMVHIADILEHGYLTGHGKYFFKHKKKINYFGLRLRKDY